ncbi:MAG: carbamoyltransferase HypF, partial [Gammaproteobacteria bacterium]|nr:carbamoyltransferase HypF [Gammaproteobacteria bacterium]
PDKGEADLLRAPQRPTVLCPPRSSTTTSPLASAIAPGLNAIGAMLPYSPLHHLILQRFRGPLVATSGNCGGDPVITTEEEAEELLTPLVDGQLHHNRPILRPADDSLYRLIASVPRPLRLGRGVTPLELHLPSPLPHPLLAVGGQMKNCIALAWDQRVVISPHIGDLGSPRSQQVWQQVMTDLQQLYRITAEEIVCDAHPNYLGHTWAQHGPLPYTTVFHHHAHASALYGEQRGEGEWLIFTWDGTGFGEDGTIWGGEALLGRPGHWRRFATLRPFHLPGGDLAARHPWRSAVALSWESQIEIDAPWPTTPTELQLLHQAWAARINAPRTSSVGRLFDAVSMLCGCGSSSSYEGEGPAKLEALAQRCLENGDPRDPTPPPLPLTYRGDHKLYQLEWGALLTQMADRQQPPAERAVQFHQTLAATIAAVSAQARSDHEVTTIGLCGGVFQNRLLSELAQQQLQQRGFSVKMCEQLPAGDGGIAYGQVIEYGSSPLRSSPGSG